MVNSIKAFTACVCHPSCASLNGEVRVTLCLSQMMQDHRPAAGRPRTLLTRGYAS